MRNVSISLYGAFRQLGVQQITLEVTELSTVAELRDTLEKYLKIINAKIPSHLVKASVFATDELVLKESDLVADLKCVAILPPVCGG